MNETTMHTLLKDLRQTLVRSTYVVDRVLRDMEEAQEPDRHVTQPRGPGFEYKGTWHACANATEVMVGVLRRLAAEDAEFPSRYVARLRYLGTKRRYVAETREALYPGRPDLAQYSREFITGWYVGTNESNATKRRLINLASEVAGLTYGVDLRVQF